jgi:cobalt-zinc-cadmium efflux system protein
LLGAVITSVILITGSVIVITSSVERFAHPEPVKAYGMFWLAIFAIVMNGFGAWLLSRGTSRNESILNLHMLEDILGWVGVLVVSIAMQFGEYYWLDPLLSLCIALFILTQAIPKFIGTIKIMLEGTPDDINYAELLDELDKLPEVRAITQFFIWSIDGEQNAVMMHMMVTPDVPLPEAKAAVRRILAAKNVEHSAIELDFSSEEHAHHANS